MTIRMPGSMSGLVDPKLVEQLIEAEKIPIDTAKMRKEKIVTEKNEVGKLDKAMSELSNSVSLLKSKGDFYKFKVESSHPDIIDGTIKGYVVPGTYEFEVRGLAKSEKQLAYGFPDKDQTEVGFGWMSIEREGQDDLEVEIEPGATLQDVARKINDVDNSGLKAMVINTKYKPDSYRLLVMSEKSGKESRVKVDEDTTYLEFKSQVTGRDLDVLFEDVPVCSENNDLSELIDGVVFHVKRSEPGTRVQVNIAHDVDKTLEGIKGFVDKYNAVQSFIYNQFALDPETNKPGVLAADSSLRMVQRSLQGALGFSVKTPGKYSTLAEIGITTEPKQGILKIDEAKVKASLADDYDSVAALFIRGPESSGAAEKLSESVKNLMDSQSGVIKSRERGLDNMIKSQDQDIDRKERNMEKKEEDIRRKFSALEGRLAGLKSQGNFLAQKLGGAPQAE